MGAVVSGEAIVVIRDGAPTGAKDRYGRDVLGLDVETTSTGWAFAPAGSSEPVAVGRTEVITLDTLYRRGTADITAADRVRVRGAVREVEGDPADWVHYYSGRFLGVVVRLKTVEG